MDGKTACCCRIRQLSQHRSAGRHLAICHGSSNGNGAVVAAQTLIAHCAESRLRGDVLFRVAAIGCVRLSSQFLVPEPAHSTRSAEHDNMRRSRAVSPSTGDGPAGAKVMNAQCVSDNLRGQGCRRQQNCERGQYESCTHLAAPVQNSSYPHTETPESRRLNESTT